MNKYDVIRIDIADIFSRRNDANEALNYIEKGILEDLAEVYTDIVNVQEDKIADVLDRINSRTGTKFVIIIDECHMKIVDKPAMIIELKWKKNAGTSIKQIKDKKYVAGLEGYHGKVLLVGISYDKLMRGETDKIKEHSCSIEEIEM